MFTIVVDYGKPYEISCDTLVDVKQELAKLKVLYEESPDDFPYFDVVVLDEQDNEVEI